MWLPDFVEQTSRLNDKYPKNVRLCGLYDCVAAMVTGRREKMDGKRE